MSWMVGIGLRKPAAVGNHLHNDKVCYENKARGQEIKVSYLKRWSTIFMGWAPKTIHVWVDSYTFQIYESINTIFSSNWISLT